MAAVLLFLKAYWKPIAIIIIILGVLAYVRLEHHRGYTEGYAARKEEDMRRDIANQQAQAKKEAELRTEFAKQSAAHAALAGELQERVDLLMRNYSTPRVRICPGAAATSDSSRPSVNTSGRGNGVPTGQDSVPRPDITDDLVLYARDAETYRLAMISCRDLLQSERTSQSQKPPQTAR